MAGLPLLIVDGGLAQRSFEDPTELGVGGTWEPWAEGDRPTPGLSSAVRADAIHGDRTITVDNRASSFYRGGIQQKDAAAGQILKSGETWTAHVWGRVTQGSTATVTVSIFWKDSQGVAIQTYTASVAIDDTRWWSCPVAATVPANAHHATVRIDADSWQEVEYDLASFGPSVAFDLPWRQYQTTDSPAAMVSRSAYGVDKIQFVRMDHSLAIETAPEDADAKARMVRVSEYLARGYLYDAYPDLDAPTTRGVFVRYGRGGAALTHSQGRGRELYTWSISGVDQGLLPTENV